MTNYFYSDFFQRAFYDLRFAAPRGTFGVVLFFGICQNRCIEFCVLGGGVSKMGFSLHGFVSDLLSVISLNVSCVRVFFLFENL